MRSMVLMDTMVITVEEAGSEMTTSSTIKLVWKQPLVLEMRASHQHDCFQAAVTRQGQCGQKMMQLPVRPHE